jgi:hypothetical protein
MTREKIIRPARIYILVIIIFWIAGWNGLRLGETIFFWSTLRAYGAFPLYIAISGGTWLVVSSFLAWSLLQGKAWGRLALLFTTLGYIAWYWFDRLVLQQPHANWPFVLVANFFFLVLIIFILFSQRTTNYFKREAYGR